MIENGAWCIYAAVAGELRAPAQIDVFAVAPKVSVKQPNVLQHCPAVGGSHPGRAKHIDLIVKLALIPLPDASTVGDAVRPYIVARGMQPGAVVP